MNKLQGFSTPINLRTLLENNGYPKKAIYSKIVEGSMSKINGYIEIEVLDVIPDKELVKLKFHTNLLDINKDTEVWYSYDYCDRFVFIADYQ